MAIAGNVFVAIRPYQHGRSSTVPSDLGVLDGIKFHLGELHRQVRIYRDRRARILAYLPGVVLIILGALGNKPKFPTPPAPYLPVVLLLAQESRTIASLEQEIRQLEAL